MMNLCFGHAVNSCGSEQRHRFCWTYFYRMLYSRTVSLLETDSCLAIFKTDVLDSKKL